MLKSKKTLFTAAAVSLLLLTSACSNTAKVDAVGTWGDTSGPHLNIEKDNSFSGNDGCNNIFGSWEQTGDEIDFGAVGTTLMACEGVDTWLSTIATGKIQGNSMLISDASGAEIGQLVKN